MFGLISFCACVWVSFSILFCSGGVEPGGLGVVRVPLSSWLAVLEHPAPPQNAGGRLLGCPGTPVVCGLCLGARSRWLPPGGSFLEEEVWARWSDGRHRQRAAYESPRRQRPGKGLCVTSSVCKSLETTARWSQTQTRVGQEVHAELQSWMGISDSQALEHPARMLTLAA